MKKIGKSKPTDKRRKTKARPGDLAAKEMKRVKGGGRSAGVNNFRVFVVNDAT